MNQHCASGRNDATFCPEATATRRSLDVPPKRMVTSDMTALAYSQ